MVPWNHNGFGNGRRIALTAALLLGLTFSSLDASIVSTSLISISSELRDFMNAPWVILSYLLAYLGFAIGFAKLSDIYGRHTLLCVAWVMFAGFSIGCALAKTMTQLIIFRAFQGVGGSGLYSLAQIGLFEVGPAHKPALMGGLIGFALATAYVLGPVLGGIISSQINWRWVFWINLPFGALATAIFYFLWPRHIGGGLGCGGWAAVKKIDFLGNILILAASTLLVFALQEGGTFTYAWDSPIIVATLVVASVSWVSFVVWQLYLGIRRNVTIDPVLPFRLITQRVYLASLACTLITGSNYLAIIIILPERFQIVNQENALYAGIHLLPLLGATAFASFLAGAVSRSRNNTSPTLIASGCLQPLGVGLLSTLSDTTTINKAQYGFQVVLGLGVGLALGAATIVATVESQRCDLAAAHGAIAQARVFGGAVGIAACGIIVNARVQSELAGKIDPADLQAVHRSPAITQSIPPNQQSFVRSVYAAAFAEDMNLLLAFSVVGLIASFFTFERNPKPLPTLAEITASTEAALRHTNKNALGGSSRSSETELAELVTPHRVV